MVWKEKEKIEEVQITKKGHPIWDGGSSTFTIVSKGYILLFFK